MSVMTHGVHKILRHYQGTKHFPRDQLLRLETPGSRVLVFDGKTMRGEEVEQQRERILRAPHVVRDREYPFSEYLIVDSSSSVEDSLPVLWLKHCVWAGATNCSISCGPVLSDCWAGERRYYVVTR